MKIQEVEIVKTKSEKVKARADVHFGWFWLKGFKILFDEEKNRNYVTPPSYLSGFGWRALFKTDNKEDWNDIQKRILKTFDEYEIEESMKE